jgi:hypothetical protein
MPPKEDHPRELIIPVDRVGKQALRIIGPMVLVYLLTYTVLWPANINLETFKQAFPANPLVVLGILVGGVILHEGLHGLVWALFSKRGFRSIRFGILLKMLAPYCHCTEPINLYGYMAGGFMPGLVMGIAPAVYALFTGSMGWLLFGILFTVAAGGDFAMMWLLRKVPPASLVKDHPSELGCYIYEPDH